MLVQNGLVRELNNNNLVQLVCQTTVQSNPFMCGGNDQFPYHFRKWYDFSRTAASVLRLYMLEASGMRALYDPAFSTKNRNMASCIIQRNGVRIKMAHGYFHRAARFAAEFDRLFPHSLIEDQLQGMDVGQTETISEHMYVIYFDEKIIYQIDATMDVTLRNRRRRDIGRNIRASVHVVVSKHDFEQPTINPRNQDEFKRFTLVKDLVNEWSPSQNPANDSSSDSRILESSSESSLEWSLESSSESSSESNSESNRACRQIRNLSLNN